MKKYLTISELEQGGATDPIWALNGSAQSDVGTAGEVHIGIPKINGTRIDALYLPQTWLAQCLTDQIPRAQLLASSELRNAVNSKLLIIVTPEYAARINAQEGAEEERDKLSERRRQVKEATAARSIAQSGAEIVNASEISDKPQEQQEANPSGLSDAFLTFASSLENKGDIEIMNSLRSRGRITRKEINHLISTLKDKPKTVNFLKDKIS
jgi:hypothetical protein